MMTIPRQNVLLSWSSGKDSAWALHVLRQQPGLEVVGLLTTFNEAFDRVAMHAVRRELVEAQAAAASLRPPDLWDSVVEPSSGFRLRRRSSTRVAAWCRDR